MNSLVYLPLFNTPLKKAVVASIVPVSIGVSFIVVTWIRRNDPPRDFTSGIRCGYSWGVGTALICMGLGNSHDVYNRYKTEEDKNGSS